MFDKDRLTEIEKRGKEWEEGALKESLKRFGTKENPNKFYTPLDIREFDFLEDVGFPGEYPFTAGKYPTAIPGAEIVKGAAALSAGTVLTRAGRYSGYGAPEDTRDYYKEMALRGWQTGPNLAFHLPTQCGHDSAEPISRGEVGKVGVAVDTLRDFEVIYEAFVGDRDLDKIASNFTINAPANIILAMYIALAEERGISPSKLRGTPQNDILKEFAARGTYIFPPGPSMRMVSDTITYCTQNMPLMNIISICGYHMREAGATRVQSLAFTISNAIAYVQLGVDAGLDVNAFVPRFTFLTFSGSLEMFKEIALRRAARRMWARIMRDRFKAKNPRTWVFRDTGGTMAGYYTMTAQRPLNNLTRAVIGGVAAALSGDIPSCEPPYDEPLGLGWSLEAQQLSEDASRIIFHEARLCDVIDPLAGSYYIEALTDQTEEEAWEIINRIEAMGGSTAAIEKGYIQQEIAKSAYLYQKEIEKGERVVVGVNKFIGENELEVTTTRLVPHPYDPKKRAEAEKRQLANLAEVKRKRNHSKVKTTLRCLEEAAQEEKVNLIPPILEAVKAYATVGEMCGVLRKTFGEYQGYGVV